MIDHYYIQNKPLSLKCNHYSQLSSQLKVHLLQTNCQDNNHLNLRLTHQTHLSQLQYRGLHSLLL